MSFIWFHFTGLFIMPAFCRTNKPTVEYVLLYLRVYMCVCVHFLITFFSCSSPPLPPTRFPTVLFGCVCIEICGICGLLFRLCLFLSLSPSLFVVRCPSFSVSFGCSGCWFTSYIRIHSNMAYNVNIGSLFMWCWSYQNDFLLFSHVFSPLWEAFGFDIFVSVAKSLTQ